MRKIFWFVLYTAVAFGANPVTANPLDALRQGEMRNFNLIDPVPVPDVPVQSLDGQEMRIADLKGKVVLLNFWATWCVPCKTEMPALDRLEKSLGGETFAVIPVATGRQAPASIEKFFSEAKIESLPIWIDSKPPLARAMGVSGLPTTLLIDKTGNERGRLVGPAEWDSPEARALIEALIAE